MFGAADARPDRLAERNPHAGDGSPVWAHRVLDLHSIDRVTLVDLDVAREVLGDDVAQLDHRGARVGLRGHIRNRSGRFDGQQAGSRRRAGT